MLIDNLNRSTRTVFYTALIIIAAIAMYDWIVAPHVTCLSAAQQYESVVSSAVEKNKTVALEVEAKTKKLEELSRQLAASRSTLFAPSEATAFFSDLQTIAEGTGCKVHALSLVGREPSSQDKQKTEDTSGITANKAAMTVSGRYNNIFAMVEELQNHAKKVWLDSFKIETINFDPAQLKCDMTIIVYTVGDEEIAL
jgi:hypothetical protein